MKLLWLNFDLSDWLRYCPHYLAIAVLANPANCLATNRALIIGVSTYDNLDESLQLAGPINDVNRVVKFLQRRGFKDSGLTILANCPVAEKSGCIESHSEPTRANIIKSMEQLIAESRRGDSAFVYFSGHGSQQPARLDSQELDDGLDEIFLPSDVGPWDGESGLVINSIPDNELAGLIARLRNKGAFVFAVFDTCHAGTMLRAAEATAERDRRVDPVIDLGVPKSLLDVVNQRMVEGYTVSSDSHLFEREGVPLEPNAGAFVAFYAAQPNEKTPELNLPVGQHPRQMHGLFTFTLMQVIDSFPDASYRQINEQVISAYDAMNRARPTPMVEGTDLDSKLFGQDLPNNQPQWAIRKQNGRLTVSAGTLYELTEGSLLRVMTQPAGDDHEAIGMIKIVSAGLHSSIAEPVAGEGFPVFDPAMITDSARARLVWRNLVRRLIIGRQSSTQLANRDSAEFDKLLERLADDPQLLVDWVSLHDPADLYLLVEDDRIWLLPPSGELIRSGLERTPSIFLRSESLAMYHELRGALLRVGRVSDLLRLAGQVPTGEQLVDLRLLAKTREASSFEPISGSSRVRLREGDEIRLEFRNRSQIPVDVNVLFIDSDWGITSIFPGEESAENRLAPGRTHRLQATIDAKTTGLEHLMLIAVPGTVPKRANYLHLSQEGITGIPGVTRGDRKETVSLETVDNVFKADRDSFIKVFSWLAIN